MSLCIRYFWISFCLIIMTTSVAQARLLVASTQPLYLIAQAVSAGIEQPMLLIPAQQDGHHVQIKPEDRRRVQHADLVLWVGTEYEAGLSSLLSSKPNAIALTSLPTLQRLPLRNLDGQPRPNTLDPHVWLAPYNAIFTAHLIAHIGRITMPINILNNHWDYGSPPLSRQILNYRRLRDVCNNSCSSDLPLHPVCLLRRMPRKRLFSDSCQSSW